MIFTPPAIGYKVIVRSVVHDARTLDEAAERVAGAYRDGRTPPIRVRACTSLTCHRDLTDAEQRELVDKATRMVVG
jgi:hypothetical protein